ncbi:thiamine pyrophosphate-binding protein [Aliarcobacter skirrowii]|uniref:thiamine pyrophosphate-binding protein n=1 Tax=Aliarcobacter skirrowii TaxID=28200 RepID=UPI0029A9F9C8|nr:thiamine pyrophosphate-binding protein [Aliarcobacter skirrowii]MDX4067815.1 thiamine pyrophosphate-binding protein [Aliarcobacter skirrowii]
MITVADYITKFLIKEKVGHVFGFQGGAILKILDSMISSGKIEYIQNYHEQASSFCADSYSRISHNIGVAIGTSGPGATNLINGIANAYFDSIPCLFITGQDYVQNITKPETVRQNGFQDLDIVSIVKPITKYASTIFEPNKIRYELEKAFYFAKSGRPGSVVLDIPIDIQFKEVDEEKLESFIPPVSDYEIDKIKDIIPLLQNAKRPVILAGGALQNSNLEKEFKRLVQKINIPVVTTLNGIDSFKDSLGFSGLYGNTESNLAVYNADLILVLGSRLGIQHISKKPESYSKNAKFVHVDIDSAEHGRKIIPELSILCDLKWFLKELDKLTKEEFFPKWTEWKEQLNFWKEKYSKNAELNHDGIDPVKFVRVVSDFFEDDAIITADVGQNQMWVAQGIKIKGTQRLLNSSGFGSMGYSLPASIGALFASKGKKQIISFNGDGGFQMNLQELLLISKKQLDIKIIVFNNNTLGMMREVQKRYFNEHYYGADEKDFQCVDLKKLSKAYDLKYYNVSEEKHIPKLEKILKKKEAYIIDVNLSKDTLLLNKYDEIKIFEENILDD